MSQIMNSEDKIGRYNCDIEKLGREESSVMSSDDEESDDGGVCLTPLVSQSLFYLNLYCIVLCIFTKPTVLK